jgi:predicted  nucleic acid-binding Zn-ribbon protein
MSNPPGNSDSDRDPPSEVPDDPQTLKRMLARAIQDYFGAKQEAEEWRWEAIEKEMEIQNLRQRNEQLRKKIAEEKQDKAQKETVRDAERIIQSIRDAYRQNGLIWDSIEDLKGWVLEELNRLHHSPKTIENRLEMLGVLHRSGTKGHTGASVRKTVQNCVSECRDRGI